MEENGSYTDTDNDPGFGNYYSVVADDGEGGLTDACEPVGIEIK